MRSELFLNATYLDLSRTKIEGESVRNFFLIILSSAAIIPFGSTVTHADPMSMPAMSGPLTANPDPFQFDVGPLGNVHVTGAVSGLALRQDNSVPGDGKSNFDVSNAQVFVQKTDGLFQFFVQVGDYSIPSLGAAYIRSNDYAADTLASCRRLM